MRTILVGGRSVLQFTAVPAFTAVPCGGQLIGQRAACEAAQPAAVVSYISDYLVDAHKRDSRQGVGVRVTGRVFCMLAVCCWRHGV